MNKPELTSSIIEFASKDNAKSTRDYLTREEKSELVKEVGLDGFYLFDHYLCKSHVRNVNLDDKVIGELIGWSARKTADVRRKLIATGYMKTVTYSNYQTGQKFTKTILGKVLVQMNNAEVENLKRGNTTDITRAAITKHFGLSSWEEVMATKSYEEIYEASMLFT
ncbi:hypothetical protein AVV30_gp110 [Vibrio phage phi 1]|uniref:Uncharacterized protein n=1 Tax=Vibrio phage phi 1 TaxID=1589297 RepID=A0A0B5H8P4_9CAUD|nr:hypothetical protein AVV30_gp110 [Vibrio phage phi 1]AJF40768.1 hypothetical protein SBVP1_0110 [Vibrio phage phi 1]